MAGDPSRGAGKGNRLRSGTGDGEPGGDGRSRSDEVGAGAGGGDPGRGRHQPPERPEPGGEFDLLERGDLGEAAQPRPAQRPAGDRVAPGRASDPEVDPAGEQRFVRAELLNRAGEVVADNNYWQSQLNDDPGDPRKDDAFALRQNSWADMSALNTMPKAGLEVSAGATSADDGQHVDITLRNPTKELAFFERAELTADPDGDEILPIQYSDNYVTVYPEETVHIHGLVPKSGGSAHWVRVGGYNSPPVTVPIGSTPPGRAQPAGLGAQRPYGQ